jgi:hypothetical protein
MLKAQLVDGHGRGGRAKINGEGEFAVVVHQHPPIDEDILALPFRQRFTDDGTASGSDDMTVDGSGTAAEYSVLASANRDIYIKSISVIIGDGGSPALNKFGELSALSSGVGWTWSSITDGTITLHDGIKTNLEFVRLGFSTGAVGDGTSAFLSDVSGGATEKSYIPQIDLAQQFGLPWGIRLRKGTTDKMSFIINDDLTGLITMNAIAYGTQI